MSEAFRLIRIFFLLVTEKWELGNSTKKDIPGGID